MNTIKWELEDLAFATLYPKRYDEIVRLVAERAPSRDTQLAEVVEKVSADLQAAKIKATVTGRPKHYYSIYQKMIVRGRDFADIYDLVGIRVLVDSVRDCYAALGTIHALWNPVPGRFKDYIAMPKFNMYQSLHTTVIGPEGKPVEMQIRTLEMHKRAEYGIAAHWKYKEGSAQAPGSGKGDDMAWLRQLLDWQKEAADPGEFLDSLRFDLHSAEVFVFTPKGDVISLPAGATPVDFAYAVHTEVGHRCIGARVNGRLVPLESTLDNGDVVEIFTTKAETAHPSQDWLQFVKSPRARNKIRQWFAKERREDAVETGKDAIGRAMRKQGLPLQRLLGGDALLNLAKEMRLADVTALYVEVGEGRISAQTVVQRIMAGDGRRRGRRRGPGRDRRPDPPACPAASGRATPASSSRASPTSGSSWPQVLHAGARRRRRRLRHPRPRRLGAPPRLHQRRRPAGRPGPAGRGRVGADRRLAVPGQHPGRGARPHPAAVRRHAGAVRRPRQHPVGDRHHHPRPGRGLAVHLRDGRPQAPGPPARPGPHGRRRLRRLPRPGRPQGSVSGVDRPDCTTDCIRVTATTQQYRGLASPDWA